MTLVYLTLYFIQTATIPEMVFVSIPLGIVVAYLTPGAR